MDDRCASLDVDAALWMPRSPRPAPLRLFCLPHAGGGASAYRHWADALAPAVDVCPVQLPGREERFQEPAYSDVRLLLPPLAGALLPACDVPFAVFGHSMGAVVAYELARRLQALGRAPAHLVVSGSPAPQRLRDEPPIGHLPRARFLEELRRLGGTAPEVLADAEMMAAFLPLLRADFRLLGGYAPFAGPPLRCPVTVLWGRRDLRTAHLDPGEWQVATTGPVQVGWFDGGHFFPRERSREVLAHLRGVLVPEERRAAGRSGARSIGREPEREEPTP